MRNAWKLALFLCAWMPLGWGQKAPEIVGDWNGTIAGQLRVSLHIERSEDQSLKVSLESPDQGPGKFASDETSFTVNRELFAKWKQFNATYEGTLSPDGSEIVGAWQQGGSRVALSLKKSGVEGQSTTKVSLKRGKLTLEPCQAASDIPAYCSTFDVFENRTTKAGRKIPLNVMILPAKTEKPLQDPVFAFAGGPGQSSIKAYPQAAYIRTLQMKRDIVLIDQRGTGKSNPLHCPVPVGDVQTLIGRPYSLETLSACRADLEKRADLTQYTTSIAADDVDDVRDALGYSKINITGGSYGTLAAQVYLRRHGAHVRTASLSGVAPTDYKIPLSFAGTIQSSVEHLFADCAADANCKRDFPNIKTQFEAIVDRLDKEPAKIEVQGKQVVLSRGAFVSALRPILYQPNLIPQMPFIIERAYENDWSLFAPISIAMHRALLGEIARGMAFSVSCSEATPFITEPDVTRETKGTYLGDHDVRIYQKACAQWPHADVSKDFLEPVKSDVPVIMIAGEEDPATPPALARHAAQSLSHGRVIAIPHGTHASGSSCVDGIITRFIDEGSEANLDVSCVNQSKPPRFVTREQIDRALGRTAR